MIRKNLVNYMHTDTTSNRTTMLKESVLNKTINAYSDESLMVLLKGYIYNKVANDEREELGDDEEEEEEDDERKELGDDEDDVYEEEGNGNYDDNDLEEENEDEFEEEDDDE